MNCWWGWTVERDVAVVECELLVGWACAGRIWHRGEYSGTSWGGGGTVE